MAIMINKPEALGITVIKPQYLCQKENQKLLKILLESYKKYGFAECNYLTTSEDWDKEWFLMINNMCVYSTENVWKEQLKLSEESIIKYYKEDLIKKLNEKLESGDIGYDQFVKKTKELDEIKLVANSKVLDREELKENIVEEKQIKFNKFLKLSNILKLVQNDLLVIGSMTGTGKTGFMLNLLSDLMKEYQCIYFNLEMSKSSIYKRLIAINADVSVDCVNKPINNGQKEVIDKAIDKIHDSKVIIEHQVNDVAEIQSIIAQNKDKSKHTIIFIDHLGLTKIDGKKSLYEQMTEIMKMLRKICLDYDCTIVGASQLNRSAYSSEELTISMFKDSGEIEQSSRKAIILSRDKNSAKEDLNPVMNIDVVKNDSGATGIMQMKYEKIKQIFTEIKR